MMMKYMKLSMAMMTFAVFQGTGMASGDKDAKTYENALKTCIKYAEVGVPKNSPPFVKLVCDTLLKNHVAEKQVQKNRAEIAKNQYHIKPSGKMPAPINLETEENK